MNWQRLESSMIDPEINEGLAANIADPYWLLARQWQVGEFRGEDAANPVFVELEAESVQVDLLRLGGTDSPGPIVAHQVDAPLEPTVEAESVLDSRGWPRLAAEAAHTLAAEFRARPILAPDLDDLLAAFQVRYPLEIPDDPVDRAGGNRLALFARHLFDGIALLEEILLDPDAVLTWGATLGLTDAQNLEVVEVLIEWGRDLGDVFVTPPDGSSWNSGRMEYEFQVAATVDDAGGGIALVGRDYDGKRLDWFNFDFMGALPTIQPTSSRVTTHRSDVLPTPLTYPGMPASRFWEFENQRVHFGGIDAAPEDLARVSLAAYATVYGDDWYVVPLTLPAHTLVAVTSVKVIDDFDGETDVPAAAVADGTDRAFKFFELTGDPSTLIGRAPMLFLAPTVETTDAGTPLDDLRIARDEAANLAWAVEHRIESPYGRAIDPLLGVQAAVVEEPDHDDWIFRLTGEVPENWVPLVPIRVSDDGSMGLQRGRMPIPGTTKTRGAQGSLLEPEDLLVIEESEVPEAGLRILRRFQSARSVDGQLHVWLGRQKGPGRPAARSGFVFDAIDRR